MTRYSPAPSLCVVIALAAGICTIAVALGACSQNAERFKDYGYHPRPAVDLPPCPDGVREC